MNQPGCHAQETRPKAPWALDEGRSCMNAASPHLRAELLRLYPGCETCARFRRAQEVWG